MNIGLLGELQVEIKLVEQGWHPLRLDSAQMASNADLLAVNKRQRISIQVKTTDASRKHSHSDFLGFGYSTAYLRDHKDIFNSKESPLIADVIVGVNYKSSGSRFVVLPVAFAEALCREHCDYWHSVPTGTESGKRSHSFPIYLCFARIPNAHVKFHERTQRNLLAFENAWHILNESIDKLHDAKRWKLAK